MAVPQMAAELHPSSILATADPKDSELWAPKAFATIDTKIYIIRASHRGDMYHVRGAMTLEPHPLLVYECTSSTTELTDYLKKPVPSENDVFLTPFTWDQLAGAINPGGSDYSKRKFSLYSESVATTVIRNKVTKDNRAKLANGMAIIDKNDQEAITNAFEGLCKELFAKQPSTAITTILIQYRDTGTKGGIYPELDSSEDSILEIASYINAIPKKGTESLNIELCGNAQPIGSLHSIGEYFKRIDSSKWPKETKRDLETFFLKVAFEKGYFKMALGFRSGGLDVFTFLSVPSISISVRQMVGEGRHGEIAVEKLFERWNIQYELPRHITTKYFGTDKNLLGSPWWKFDDSRKPTADELKQQSDPPSKFHDFDGQIVRIGIYNAIVVLLKWDHGIFIKPTVQSREFSNKICRPCYFSNMSVPKGEVSEFQKGQRTLEEKDFVLRKGQITYRNEAQKDFDRWEAAMKSDWAKIIK